MTMKGKMLAAMAMMAMIDPFSSRIPNGYSDDDAEEIARKRNAEIERRKVDEVRHKIQKGLKLFTFGEVEIWALNLKNAERKFNRMNK